MTQAERQQLKALLVATALYYGQELADEVLKLYVEDLEDLPFDQVVQAVRDLRRNPKINRCPLPAVIREQLAPAENPEGEAREAASRILAAVARFGWCNPDRARAFIGSLGWHVVELQGGWQNVCETLTQDNSGMLQAQWRELALGSLRRAKSGTLHRPPALPEVPRNAMNSPTLMILPKAPDDEHQRKRLETQLEHIVKGFPAEGGR